MKFRHWIGCVLAIGGLVHGCTNSIAPPEETTSEGSLPVTAEPGSAFYDQQVSIDAEEHLARLDALGLFEVGDLIVEGEGEAFSCYGPCPGFEEAIAEVTEQQEQRLARFVEIAEEVHETEQLDLAPISQEPREFYTSLSALASLRIVHVGEMIESEAAPSPYCYNLVCPGDQERVDAENERRSEELALIAHRATREL